MFRKAKGSADLALAEAKGIVEHNQALIDEAHGTLRHASPIQTITKNNCVHWSLLWTT